jgi:hypothetical protein
MCEMMSDLSMEKLAHSDDVLLLRIIISLRNSAESKALVLNRARNSTDGSGTLRWQDPQGMSPNIYQLHPPLATLQKPMSLIRRHGV